MDKKISINDIARELKVSTTTVSFVLNGKAQEKRISEGLVKIILDYVERVGYKPSHLAKSLRTGKSNVIVMLVEDISDPFFSSIARLIEQKTYDSGYKIVFCSTENDTEKTRELIKVFTYRKVDGFIIAPSPGIEGEIQSLVDQNIPFVLFDRFFPGLHCNSVVVDNYTGTYNAVHHLAKNGYDRIAFITLQSTQTQMDQRLRGYTKALVELGKKPILKQIPYELHLAAEKEIAGFMEQNKNSLDAVIFATNYLGITGLEVLNKLNIKLPNELGIIVFDDSTLFKLITPSITAIAQPLQEISDQIIQILFKALAADKPIEKRSVLLQTRLIERKSSAERILI
ncbi:MAG: LacI family transcriptional regulator [Sphingobacteriales bacterium]|nr:LacI family transcriptional regulator [Sphingobacteriales bacterium]